MSSIQKPARKKRNRRRKFAHKKAPANDVLSRAFSEREETIKEILTLEENESYVSKQAEEILNRSKKIIASEFEIFISNIPYHVDAKELAIYLSSQLDNEAVVVRCQILEKNSRSMGSAIVLLKSKDLFLRLHLKCLMLQGRRLNIKEGNGQSKRHRRIHDENTSFSINQIDIGWSKQLLNAEYFISDWCKLNDDCLEFQIISSKRAISIGFKHNENKYKIEIFLSHIRNVQLKHDMDDPNNVILLFQCMESPLLYGPESNPFSTIFDNILGLFSLNMDNKMLLSGMKSKFLWEVDIVDHDELVRTIDCTHTNAFGRCLVYRIKFNIQEAVTRVEKEKPRFGLRRRGLDGGVRGGEAVTGTEREREFQRLLKALQDYRILKSKTVNISPSVTLYQRAWGPEREHRIWAYLESNHIPFSVLYLLHCLYAKKVFDLFSLSYDYDNTEVTTTNTAASDQAAILDETTPIHYEVLDTFRVLLKAYSNKRIEFVLKYLFYGNRVHFQDFLSGLRELLNDESLGLDDEAVATAAAAGDSYYEEEKDESDNPRVEEDADDVEEEPERDTMLVRRVYATPLRICPQPPEPEASNRVLRQYRQHLDRFMRVLFVDESFGSILQAGTNDIFERRIRPLVHDGIIVCGRRFIFLAYSNSQIREHSAWFYDESIHSNIGDGSTASRAVSFPSAEDIRRGVGDLSSIRIPGKHAARLGQGFSNTVPGITVPTRDFIIVDDVIRNNYVFSDGVGMICESFADKIKENLRLSFSPSAYQIRFGGAKGMLVVTPDGFLEKDCSVAFRPSMMKFESTHRELEICGYAKAIPFFLNRQIITLLSSRGIRDEVFLTLLQNMTNKIDSAMRHNDEAIEMLYCHADIGYDDESVAPLAGVWSLLHVGVDVQKDRYVRGMMRAVRRKLLLDIQTKTRIFVPGAICLIGVMDEYGLLREGEVFVQSRDRRGAPRIWTGLVAVGRSPSLHPGDIRRLIARDVAELRHLVNVVVFPSRGSRPHANEMSGGDLDGDIYFVISDPNLIPASDFPAATYAPPPTPSELANVSIRDVEDFFVNYIKNDNLGKIANAHLIHADINPSGARCTECLQLAQLHSTAVDFLKTGVPADFPPSLRTSKSPTFMNQPNKSQYESTKVLGIIHKRIEDKIEPYRRSLAEHDELVCDRCTSTKDLKTAVTSRQHLKPWWSTTLDYGVL